jgi:glycosyltransferase involved in cell wall biosynthesis
MYRGQRIAVVMPVHNEQAHIERAIKRVPGFVDLVVAVDDGSTDDTWGVLSRVSDGRLTKLRHDRNSGVGAATKTGYLHCLKDRAGLIAVMDGDGQMDGRDLVQLVDRALNGVEYVKGNRFLHAESIGVMPRLRYIGNRFLSWLTRRAASYDENLDAHCGYTVIQHQALKRLPLQELYDRYGFPTEMFFAACRAGLAVESVPVRTVYGDEVSGVNPLTAVPAILYLIARNYVRRRFPAASKMAFDPGQAEPAQYHFEA